MAPTLSGKVIIESTPTAKAPLTATSNATLIVPTLPPRPTLDPNFFREEFITALDSQWTWVREDPDNWSLEMSPGSLQINTSGGYVLAHSNANLLLRPAPEGDFQIETQIAFEPRFNFELAGLIIYESDSDFIQAGRGFCSSVDCIGEGLYLNSFYDGAAQKPNPMQTYLLPDDVFLRVSRRGNTYTFENSENGNVWFFVGSQISDIHPIQIGLVASQNLKGDILPARFRYFTVRSLP
jgi:beta-xylosidase